MDINQIAQMAGVSRATVSRYLNDGYVSQEKRAAIRRVNVGSPDRIELSQQTWLSICPQGMEEFPWSNGQRDQAGYMPLADQKALITPGQTTLSRDSFHLWDHGFDFYAPQTFVDATGRTILIGWMGIPETPYTSAPNNLTWCHCLTVPRELTAGTDGNILQQPVSELTGLRGKSYELQPDTSLELPEARADVILACTGACKLNLNKAVQIEWCGKNLRLYFSDDATGSGRTERRASIDTVHTLRLLIDNSALELYVNNGEIVFSTRWFPQDSSLSLGLSGAATATVWEMGDGMKATY